MLVIDNESILKNDENISARKAAITGFGMIASSTTFVLNKNLDLDYSKLNSFMKNNSGKEFIIFGFTFLVFKILSMQIKKKYDWSNAYLLHGGGWKKLEKKKISNKEFVSKLKNKFKLKKIINYYGLVEQIGSIFFECENCNRFITSEFSDIIIRDKNFSVCEKNRSGIVQLLSILPKSYPGHSILTEDLGVISGEDDCYCGKKGKYFEINGRVKNVEIRGCGNIKY